MAGQTQINQPNVTGVIVSGFSVVDNAPQKTLAVGQITTGSVSDGSLTTNVQNDNSVVNGLFGPDSMVSGMIRNFRKINTSTQIDVLALADNGTAISATGTITVTGTATESSSFEVILGSSLDYTFTVAVASGATATTVGTSIADAITASTEVPLTAANVTGVVTLTASNGGTVGNSIGIQLNGDVAGITLVVAAMASGAVDPSFTGIFDIIEGIRYQNVIWPYTTTAGITAIRNHLDPLLNSSGYILDGRASLSVTDTFSNLETLGQGLNDQNILIIGDRLVTETKYTGPGMFEIPYAKAAQNCAIRSKRLTDGENLADLITANIASLDLFGGIALASLPYFNTPLNSLPKIAADHGFTADEITDLQSDGISVWGNNLTGTSAIMGAQVTTYKTDAAANPDETFTFENYDDTAREAREFFFNNYRARFNQTRLTSGNVLAGRAMANEDTIRRFSNTLYNELGEDALVVLGPITSGDGEGLEGQQYFDDNLTITISSDETTATITMKLKIVTQLRAINFTIQVVID